VHSVARDRKEVVLAGVVSPASTTYNGRRPLICGGTSGRRPGTLTNFLGACVSRASVISLEVGDVDFGQFDQYRRAR
jgi:hypothetical protein